ncbi:MAG: phosphatase PAP2 family protein [Bacteroidia bacterium]|nr:phosphatase PAP2 family protein [Bacteroidia bacterium]HRG03693.1 phosphatase PAP2 family protein [Paludibacteraceae bacterium]
MNTFFKIITYIFQPLLIPTYGIILLMQLSLFQLFPTSYRLFAIAGTVLFTCILPSLPILFMMKNRQISDIFISKREERTMPYLFSLLAYIFWVLFLWRTLQFPMEFVLLAIGSIVSVVLMVFINLKWKISAHTAGMGGLIGGIFGVAFVAAINPVWIITAAIIIAGLVAISRILLKAHTLSQVIGGFFLGFACVFIPVIVYNFLFK